MYSILELSKNESALLTMAKRETLSKDQDVVCRLPPPPSNKSSSEVLKSSTTLSVAMATTSTTEDGNMYRGYTMTSILERNKPTPEYNEEHILAGNVETLIID